MPCRVLIAGATGAIGRRLMPLVREVGHTTGGMTRSAVKAEYLRTIGVEPLVVDVFDAGALADAVASFRPEVVIHQLTDLPQGLVADRMDEAITRNARIRNEGTRNLVQCAIAAGAHRLVAQSIAWAYAPGPEPHAEGDSLDLNAKGSRAVSVGGVVALENWTLDAIALEGVVLRYGHIYGPGTGTDRPTSPPSLHVDAAAYAALLAIEAAATGIFNIAEPNPHVATEKARTQLGWDGDFRVRPDWRRTRPKATPRIRASV